MVSCGELWHHQNGSLSLLRYAVAAEAETLSEAQRAARDGCKCNRRRPLLALGRSCHIGPALSCTLISTCGAALSCILCCTLEAALRPAARVSL